MRQLQIGNAYYRLLWADPDFTIPRVEPWLYAGINLSADDDPSGIRHYFQDTISYSCCGSLAANEPLRAVEDVEPCVATATDAELEEDSLTLHDIVERLQGAREGAAVAAKALGSGS